MKTRLILLAIILLLPLQLKAIEPTVIINEIAWMGTGVSSNDEWIELKNNSQDEIDLTGWRLEAADGSPKINLGGKISAGGFFLLERTDDESVADIPADQIYTGSLSNSGEWLKLYDNQNNLIDEINASESWPGGDNSTKQTLERRTDNSWQTSLETGGSPKVENSSQSSGPKEPVIDDQPEQSLGLLSTPETSTPKAQKGDIVINEILPNPEGTDTDEEFIELKNISSLPIDLTSWKIKNAAKQTFIIPSLTMMPNSIVLFYRRQTNLALNNSAEKITLYSQSDLIIDQINYKLSEENKSYQRNQAGKYFWQDISAGKENIFIEEVLPEAIIYGPKEAKVGEIITFDASDSFDPKSRRLSYLWDFGDGRKDQGVFVRQIYLQPDNYQVQLKLIADKNASSTEIFPIKITDSQSKINQPTTTPTTTEGLITFDQIPFVFISEFLPNPEGSDDKKEFIELFNQENQIINLAGWQLDDAEGGSHPYTIPQGTLIKPGQYLAFFRPETKLALNNSDEAIRLFSPTGEMVDYAKYDDSKEGASFVLDENFSWQQSNTPTPGEINFLNEVEQEGEKEKPETKPQVLGATTVDIAENKPKDNKNKYLISGISAAVVLGVGTILKIKKKPN